MVLSKEQPQVIRYRSSEPVLTPELPQERRGTVARRELTVATISARRNASTFTMGWPTTGLAWHALTCRMSCRREVSLPHRAQRCKAPDFGNSRYLRPGREDYAAFAVPVDKIVLGRGTTSGSQPDRKSTRLNHS